MPKNTRHLRAVLEARIHDAIELLDRIDGDSDFEPEEDCCGFEDQKPAGVPCGAGDDDFEHTAFETVDQRFWVLPQPFANQTSAQRRGR